MKKWFFTFVCGLVLLFSNTVQATESMSAEEIVEKSNQRMDEIKVIQIKEYLEYRGERDLLLEMAVDKNTNVQYVSMLCTEMYADLNDNLIYTYYSEDDRWYISIAPEGYFDTESEESTQIDQTTIISYTYKGISTYYGNECETILVEAVQEDGEVSEMTLYIKCETYELCGYSVCNEGLELELVCSYPECVEIPAEVKKNALIEPGQTLVRGKITYTAIQSGKKVVMEVTNGKKVKSGNLTIPDTITFEGKKYPVTEIFENAFKGNQKIKKVTLGKNIKKIGSKAFCNCKKLNQVTIRSKKVSKIGTKAFYGNAKKLKIKVPKAKYGKYKKLLKKSKISSKYKVSKM